LRVVQQGFKDVNTSFSITTDQTVTLNYALEARTPAQAANPPSNPLTQTTQPPSTPAPSPRAAQVRSGYQVPIPLPSDNILSIQDVATLI